MRVMSKSSSSIKVSLLTGAHDPMYSIPLASALADRNIEIDFVGNDAMQGAVGLERANIRYLNLRGSQQPAPLHSMIIRIVRYYAKLIGYARRTDSRLFHILWLNKFEVFDRTMLMLLYKLLGKKLVFTAHNVNTRKRDGRDSWVNRLTLRAMYWLLDHIFVHTELSKEELLRDYRVAADKVSVIPHGLNTYVPDTALSRAEARASLGLEADERVVLFFGLIAPYKGLDLLLDAVKVLASWNDRPRIIVAGSAKRRSDPYWPTLKSRLESEELFSRVLVKDHFIPENEVAILLKAADVLVLPYRAIYQSGPLLLAYRFGLPVIATKVGSFDRDVISDVTGFLCEPEDPEDLARAIQRYFASRLYGDREASQEQVRRIGREKYSWDGIARTIEEVYARLLNLGTREHEAFDRAQAMIATPRRR
jgi:D-inositol-3-phosphate glycosyltransferase